MQNPRGKADTRWTTWRFELEGNRHVVELEHGYFSGKRTVIVDGVAIKHVPFAPWEVGSRDGFRIGVHHCTVRVRWATMFRVAYELTLDGEPVPSQEEPAGTELTPAAAPEGRGDELSAESS